MLDAEIMQIELLADSSAGLFERLTTDEQFRPLNRPSLQFVRQATSRAVKPQRDALTPSKFGERKMPALVISTWHNGQTVVHPIKIIPILCYFS